MKRLSLDLPEAFGQVGEEIKEVGEDIDSLIDSIQSYRNSIQMEGKLKSSVRNSPQEQDGYQKIKEEFADIMN